MEKLNELFALPIGLEPKVKIDGETYYGSESLNIKFFKSLVIGEATRPYYKELRKMIDIGLIVPVFATKGLIKFLAKKITTVDSPHILGMFVPRYGKIFILIDNNIGFIGIGSDNEISKVTIHELVHYMSWKNQLRFWNVFKLDLIRFYGAYFKRILQLEKEGYEQDLEKVVKMLYLRVEASFLGIQKKKEISFNTIVNYISKLKKYSGDPKYASIMLRKYYKAIYLYAHNTTAFVNQYQDFYDLLKPLHESYLEVFKEVPGGVFYIQELIFPSEVIAIASESSDYMQKKIKSILKMTISQQ